jgi:hypothetical protein
LRFLGRPDLGDPRFHMRQPGAQRPHILLLREQLLVRDADQQRLRDRQWLGDEGQRGAGGDLASFGCGVEDAAGLAGGESLRDVEQAAL